MAESWYTLSNLKSGKDDQVTANAVIPAGSPWFSGHFPGEPIVPGIAELSIIYDVIKKFYYNNLENLKLVSLKKIRFKCIIKPEEMLDIIVCPVEKPGTFSFRITTGDNLACSGFIAVEKIIS
jgi:3-hydroxyacyl-[acyl-carrier-protein] dehydratase